MNGWLVCAGAWGMAVAVGAGCASSQPIAPTEVTRAQIRALEAGHEGDAMHLLAPETRARAPLLPGAADLPSPASVAEVERIARWSGDRELELVRGADGWRIRRGVLSLFRADTAEAAAAAFGRALEVGDASLVQELLPAEARRKLGAAELGRAMENRRAAWKALGQALAGGAIVWGVREPSRAEATVSVAGASTRVVLVREAAGWKVFDVAPWSEYIER